MELNYCMKHTPYKILRKVKVKKEDWLGDGLYQENELDCSLSLIFYNDAWIINIVCGGKHFWRLRTEYKDFHIAYTEFAKINMAIFSIIPKNVTPKWFKDKGFEWM